LAFCIAVAPVIQHAIVGPFLHYEGEDGYSLDAWNTTVVLSVLWFVVAALIAVFEPRLAGRLDRPSRRVKRVDPIAGDV
jgi:threonine/homoserine/homoserine lactone efflux protein